VGCGGLGGVGGGAGWGGGGVVVCVGGAFCAGDILSWTR